jgi:hypothetical protein
LLGWQKLYHWLEFNGNKKGHPPRNPFEGGGSIVRESGNGKMLKTLIGDGWIPGSPGNSF